MLLFNAAHLMPILHLHYRRVEKKTPVATKRVQQPPQVFK